MSTVCVHGLGYIGLPTAAVLANHGHQVHGYDIDTEKVTRLAKGKVPFDELGLGILVEEGLESGNLTFEKEISEAEYHIICVPTPFNQERKKANLEAVRSAASALRSYLRPKDTVILESTVPPGTTENVLQPILEEEGLNAKDDFGLAYSPETVLPGNLIQELHENDRIVGGISEPSIKNTKRLYSTFTQGEIHEVNNPTMAEFIKLIQNTFRDTNIGLANEIAKIAHDYDVDSRDAIQLANEHPRVDILQPGPGVGGHCLPIDPWFLGQESNNLDLIEKARDVNNSMPNYIINVLEEYLGDLSKKKIAILGVAYKGNVDDIRESPGLTLARELQKRGKDHNETVSANGGGKMESPNVTLHDPNVTGKVLQLSDLDTAIYNANAIVIAADHNQFKSLSRQKLDHLMNEKLIIDSKGILNKEEWQEEGFQVHCI